MACRGAVKSGDSVDKDWAEELLQEALRLKQPFCPHGRPIWIKITKEELYKKVRRLM